MTSIKSATAPNALSVSRKSSRAGGGGGDGHSTEDGLDTVEAEIIEVVPELVFSDDSDGFSEFSDEQDVDNDITSPFNRLSDDDMPFDEYAYQVNSNLLRKQTRGLSQNSSWSDESPRNSSQLNSSSSADDVILIDDDDDDDDRDDDYNDDDDDDDDGDHRFSGNSNGLYSNGLGLNHVANGTGEAKAYTCDICHSKLSSSYNLKRHMMIHTGEKPFECPICQRRFREQSDLRKHKKIHDAYASKCSACHRSPIANAFTRKCTSCEREESLQKTLKASFEEVVIPRLDGNNKKSFECSFCSRAFGSSSNLKRHVMIHTGEKPFTCTVCRRPFREMSTLKKHLITHRRQHGFPTTASSPLTVPRPTMTVKPDRLQSLNKCPLCQTICRGTDGLMNHINSVHRHTEQKRSDPSASSLKIRKFSKSPPPLIPINKAVFKYLNIARLQN